MKHRVFPLLIGGAVILLGWGVLLSKHERGQRSVDELRETALVISSPSELAVVGDRFEIVAMFYAQAGTHDVTDKVKWQVSPRGYVRMLEPGLFVAKEPGRYAVQAVLDEVVSVPLQLENVRPRARQTAE